MLVRGLEVDLAADRGDADRVAVVGDPGDGVVEQVAGAARAELAEPQRVEDRDRPGAHREHVAQDAAHPRGRALERLHGAGVVVGLDLERHGQPVPHVDGPRVLAGADHHRWALGGQSVQELLRVLVRAVLGPHEREDRKLHLVGLAPELLDDQRVLGVGQAESAVSRLGGGHGVHAATGTDEASELKIAAPPVGPRRGSTACSGCGISPITFPAAFVMPATSRTDPFGFSPGA